MLSSKKETSVSFPVRLREHKRKRSGNSKSQSLERNAAKWCLLGITLRHSLPRKLSRMAEGLMRAHPSLRVRGPKEKKTLKWRGMVGKEKGFRGIGERGHEKKLQ